MKAGDRVKRGFRRLAFVVVAIGITLGVSVLAYYSAIFSGPPMASCPSWAGFGSLKVDINSPIGTEVERLSALCSQGQKPRDWFADAMRRRSDADRQQSLELEVNSAIYRTRPDYFTGLLFSGLLIGVAAALACAFEILSWIIRGFLRD